MSAKLALVAAVQSLREAGIEEPARDARILLADAMGLAPERLSLHVGEALSADQQQKFEGHVDARRARIPVSKIIGRRIFWGLTFEVGAAVLDPRPETEILVAEALSQPFGRILDLGTGSGCILLSCLHGMAQADGVGGDVSADALEIAARNAEALGLSRRADLRLLDWRREGWAGALSGPFDLVVSNPPYIAEAEMAALAPEVRDHDPHIALTPGGDGLDAYRAIAAGLPELLLPGGRALLEIGPTQGSAVADLLHAAGLRDIRLLPDLDGRDRVVAARRGQ